MSMPSRRDSANIARRCAVVIGIPIGFRRPRRVRAPRAETGWKAGPTKDAGPTGTNPTQPGDAGRAGLSGATVPDGGTARCSATRGRITSEGERSTVSPGAPPGSANSSRSGRPSANPTNANSRHQWPSASRATNSSPGCGRAHCVGADSRGVLDVFEGLTINPPLHRAVPRWPARSRCPPHAGR